MCLPARLLLLIFLRPFSKQTLSIEDQGDHSMSGFAAPVVSEQSPFTQPMHRVSALLAHSKKDTDTTFNQVLRTLRSGGVLQWLSISVARDDVSNHYEFALPPQSDTEMLARAQVKFEGVVVAVDVVVTNVHQEDAPLFSSFLAQQLALFVRQRDLLIENQTLREQIRETEEAVAQRKFMDRAKSLMCNHRGYTPDEAEEWLVGASERYNKPLLSVAREIVTVLSTPGLGIDAAA
jgi:hypothetical protein